MKFTVLAALATTATAAALPADVKYGPPPGGWESIDWTKISYPKGTGENLPSYPKGTGENLPSYPPKVGSPFTFTSYFEVRAEPGQVVNGTTATGGKPGASGLYKLGLNSVDNVICYNITLTGLGSDTYQSPARTATHVHESARGQSGPPRIAFDNPVDIGNGVRRSVGCLRGPFVTGLPAGGPDNGANFHVSQIEKNPAAFNVDVHTNTAVPGAVRGQLA